MRLSPKRHELLDRLRASIERGSFDDGVELLCQLRLDPSPSLIPALLPPFVPQSLRSAQRAQPWQKREWTYEVSIAEAVFRDELVRTLRDCLARAQAHDLAKLDEQSRSYGYAQWSADHWRLLDVSELVRCLPNDLDLRFVVLALATLHGSGYIREHAIEQLKSVTSGEELPFLLLRLNDWVAPVQKQAFAAVRARVREDYAAHFARWLVLLHRMSEARRNRLSDIAQWATTLLATPAALPALVTQYDAADRHLRRAALQLVVERHGDEARAAALLRALQDSDAGIRMWVARVACEAGVYLSQLERDPCGVIRVWALRARVEREGIAAAPALRQALLDRAASVRATARFHLAQLEPSFSVVDLYRRALETETDARRLSAAIAGIGELGNRDDAALVAFSIGSPVSSLAKAAVRTCAKLARSDCQTELMQALGDPREGVSKVAQRVLAGGAPALSQLLDLLRSTEHGHARMNAIALFSSLGRWDRLIGLLHVVASSDPAASDAARDGLARWLVSFEYRPYPPTRPGADQHALVLSLLENVDDAALRERIRRAVG